MMKPGGSVPRPSMSEGRGHTRSQNSTSPNRPPLLQLDGSVGLKLISSTSYQSYFGYRLFPYDERSDGEPSKLTLRPAFRGTSETLLGSFLKTHPEPIRMSEKGVISFEVSGIEKPRLTYGSYEIFDQNGQSVGTVDFPVFSSTKQ